MELIHIIALAIMQGITEFLPVSSSAHLLLPAELLGWPDQGLVFDVAVHVGSLAAVIIYFRKDIVDLVLAWFTSLVPRQTMSQIDQNNSRLAWLIILGTVPAGLAGLLFHDVVEQHFRSIAVVAFTTVFFGILLGLADRIGRRENSENNIRLSELTVLMVLVIGFSQALALVPGTSRSGVTITAALFLGIGRVDAARLSFLLSIPIILLSGAYKALGLVGQVNVAWMELFLGATFSALSAYLCIHYFLKTINRMGMMPFVVYRLLLGAVLAWLAFFA